MYFLYHDTMPIIPIRHRGKVRWLNIRLVKNMRYIRLFLKTTEGLRISWKGKRVESTMARGLRSKGEWKEWNNEEIMSVPSFRELI